jgi:hypothetical protein
MKNKNNYFSNASKLFWGIIITLLFFLILKLNPSVFVSKDLAKEMIIYDSISKIDWDNSDIIIDSTKLVKKNDTVKKLEQLSSNWNWVDFKGKEHKIRFNFPSDALILAENNRKQFSDYSPLYNFDKILLKDLIDKMKDEIKQEKLSYLEGIEYVCSSIQYIPYTLVLNSSGIEYPPKSGKYLKCPCQTSFGFFKDNCRSIGNGCCNNVDPFGVYSPFEFAYKKTGDCDTRALLAYTILKEMGYDVAVMVSATKSHSVLGVHIPNKVNLPSGKNIFGKKYILWELTSREWRIGFPVEGNDWYTALE